MSSEGYHEPVELLSSAAMDRHRAIASLMEELEAVDWYDQRIEATDDELLAAILAHNRDEEKEHAAMTLEWLRRQDGELDHELRTYLWQPDALEEELAPAAAEPGDAAEAAEAAEPADGDGSLGIGSLKAVVA